jgi:hypothetical protein
MKENYGTLINVGKIVGVEINAENPSICCYPVNSIHGKIMTYKWQTNPLKICTYCIFPNENNEFQFASEAIKRRSNLEYGFHHPIQNCLSFCLLS